MVLVAWLFPSLEELRSIYTRRASTAFSILIRLDSRCTNPRFGPLCRDSSLERLFRGFADLQTSRGWTNHRFAIWPWLTKYYTTWFALSCYHRVDIESRSPIMRHSLWTLLWWGDRSTWGTWWWCTWYHVARAWPVYSPMATSSPECSMMPGLIWAERDFEVLNSYDTYDDLSMGLMKFEKAPDGSWVRRAETTNIGPGTWRDTSQSRGGCRDMRDGGWSRPSERLSIEGELELDIPPLRSKSVQFEATLSEPCLSRLTQWDHILNHNSLSLLTQRYHLIKHFTLLIMHLEWIYLLRLAL